MSRNRDPSIRTTQQECHKHGVTDHRVHWNGYDESGGHRRRLRCMKCNTEEELERRKRPEQPSLSAFEAKYPGRCGICNGDIAEGDFCSYSGEEIIHDRCKGSTPSRGKAEVICPQCFMTSCDHGRD